MIVQCTTARDELLLIRNLLPIWAKYADGFVFCLNNTTDESREFLESVKTKYNILEIIENNFSDTELVYETDLRQRLVDTAYKYSGKIICLDADEYLDGNATKADLEEALTNNEDTLFLMQWLQYIGASRIRIDGPWMNNLKDRIGSYSKRPIFKKTQKHSFHLPQPPQIKIINESDLFIAHLAWLDNKNSAIKQYYWKLEDYITRSLHGLETYSIEEYDKSVNNFDFISKETPFKLQIPQDIFSTVDQSKNWRLLQIEKLQRIYEIPNLGDWGYGIHNSELYKHALKERIIKLEEQINSIREIIQV